MYPLVCEKQQSFSMSKDEVYVQSYNIFSVISNVTCQFTAVFHTWLICSMSKYDSTIDQKLAVICPATKSRYFSLKHHSIKQCFNRIP